MDVEKCEILATVLEYGNIRKAAERLGYTPSGVSRAIAALEQECGITLLSRSKSGVSSTESCRQLIPFMDRAISQKRTLERAASDLLNAESGTLRIGTAYPQYHGILASLLGEFRKARPGVEISLVERNSTPLIKMLEEGDLDIAIASKRTGDFEWHPLVEDELVVLASADHPLAREGVYPLKRLERDPYIEIGPGDETDNQLFLREQGIQPNTCFSISTAQTSYKMVDAGLGVCLTNSLHKSTYAGDSVFLSTDPQVIVEIGVASARPEMSTPAAKLFLEQLLAAVEIAEVAK